MTIQAQASDSTIPRTEHELKVVAPYFGALLDGSKTFEVRRNDRAFQRGDVLVLREWLPVVGRFTGLSVRKVVSFVFSGDPRFGGIEPGYVVLGLAAAAGGTS